MNYVGWMKILFLINEFEKGGAERVVSHLLHHLPEKSPQLIPTLFILDKSEFAYPIPENLIIYTGSKFHASYVLKFLKLPFIALRLKNIIKNDKINVVVSYLNRANYTNILATCYGSNHRCIISERNTSSLTYGSKRITDIINRLLIRYLYPLSHSIIAVSKGVKKDLKEQFKIPESKISVIYNPYDINTIRQKSREELQHKWLEKSQYKTIITVGRLEKQKNHTLLIQAFKKVNEFLPETRLVILGEGQDRDKLAKLIRNLGIDSIVEMTGLQKNPFAFLSRADLFVLSSDFEGFPNVLVEAMICGCPVISTNCRSGPGEIITNGVNGILVPVGNINELSNAIITILRNAQLTMEFKKNSEKTIQNYELTRIVRQYQKALIEYP
jgi:N-acetylgalactosamine-N,N'-diacetylbacillosaminyl-diphospho-undecaprenol 4-alpha-N-acetylgalactosaminyltransferase